MRHLTKFAVYSITILTAYLVSEYFVNYLNSFYREKTYLSVLVGMGVILAVYYPIVTILDKYIQRMSKTYVNKSKVLHKNSKLGVLIGFLVAFFVLYLLFALVWHDLNLIKDFFN